MTDQFRFSGYYKYLFTFRGVNNNKVVHAGGNADDIYSADIDAEKLYTIEQLEEEFGEVTVMGK